MKKLTGYVLVEPSGSYFVDPNFYSWELNKALCEATFFETYEEAEKMKKILDSAVAGTYWDYGDIVPWPTIKKVNNGDVCDVETVHVAVVEPGPEVSFKQKLAKALELLEELVDANKYGRSRSSVFGEAEEFLKENQIKE